MKKVFIFLSAIAVLITGCSFDVHWVTPPPVEPTLSPVIPTPIVFSPSETLPVVPSEIPNVGFTPVPNTSLFYGAYPVLDPKGVPGRAVFPPGTNRIYVVWQYQNMRAGLTVKRDWYLDGALWLSREEAWDFAKYGASGTIRDVSIFDEEVGLPIGVYQLRIYIDGLLQPIGTPNAQGADLWLNFEVQADESVTEVASPDFKWSAVVSNGKKLIVRDGNGKPAEIYAGLEIAAFAWFPDSRHILLIDRDRSAGIRDKLWIVDATGKGIIPLYDAKTPLGMIGGMTISPGGRFIAITEGSGDGDACFVSLSWVFLEIGSNFESVRVLRQEQIDGLSVQADSTVYPAAAGMWQNDTQFVSSMKITCVTDNSLAGDYVFDMTTMKAVKK